MNGASTAMPLDVKEVATLRARAALAGVALHVTDDDRGQPLYVACKWALTRQLHSVAEVDHFLHRLAGQRALPEMGAVK